MLDKLKSAAKFAGRLLAKAFVGLCVLVTAMFVVLVSGISIVFDWVSEKFEKQIDSMCRPKADDSEFQPCFALGDIVYVQDVGWGTVESKPFYLPGEIQSVGYPGPRYVVELYEQYALPAATPNGTPVLEIVALASQLSTIDDKLAWSLAGGSKIDYFFEDNAGEDDTVDAKEKLAAV